MHHNQHQSQRREARLRRLTSGEFVLLSGMTTYLKSPFHRFLRLWQSTPRPVRFALSQAFFMFALLAALPAEAGMHPMLLPVVVGGSASLAVVVH